MNELRGFTLAWLIPGKAVTLLAMLLLGACTLQRPLPATPPPLRHAGPIDEVADVDVLAVSPRMEAFLERYVLPYPDPETRLQLLVLAVGSSGVLGFEYDAKQTLSATRAFNMRSGNCISFANLLIALARRAGLKAQYQEITNQPVWSNRADTLLILKHVNVLLGTHQYRYEVDVSGIESRLTSHKQILSDDRAKALYYSNIGTDALLSDQLPTAYAYLVKAIDTAPAVPTPWINLGVVYGRNQQLDDAEFAQQTALHIDAWENSALSNLYGIYTAREDFKNARLIQARVEKYRMQNPYYLWKLSRDALGEAHFGESIKLLQRAISKKENDHQLYFALAKTQYLSGQTTAAMSSLQRARELAPKNMLAFYARPLQELVEQP